MVANRSSKRPRANDKRLLTSFSRGVTQKCLLRLDKNMDSPNVIIYQQKITLQQPPSNPSLYIPVLGVKAQSTSQDKQLLPASQDRSHKLVIQDSGFLGFFVTETLVLFSHVMSTLFIEEISHTRIDLYKTTKMM